MNGVSPSEKIARRIAEGCILAGGVAALVAFLLRVFSQWWTWSIPIRPYFSMALFTAWLLTIFSTALFLHNHWPQRRSSRVFCIAVMAVVGATSLVAIGRHWFPINLEFEVWFADLVSPTLKNRVGHVSAHSAIAFLCAVGALCCLLGAPEAAPWRRRVAFLLAAATFGAGSIALLGFAAGTPLLHGRGYPSMTWMTGLIFVLLALGLILTAYPKNWLLQGLIGETSDPGDTRSIRYRRALVITLLFLNAGIGAVGFFFLRREQLDLRSRVERELAVVADLKVAQITNWRRERLKDANLIFHTPYATRRALDALERPSEAVTRDMFTGWLDPFLATGPYATGLVLNERLKVGLIHPTTATDRLFEVEREPTETALRTRRPVLADLHRSATAENTVYLSLVVPLVVRREGTHESVPAAGLAPSVQDRSVGALVLRMDVRQTLFPLVQTWPTSSRTAEIVLVRREGNEGVYLSDLRYETNAALRLRFSLDNTNTPAAAAALGIEAVFKGADYRNASVLAVTRRIPNSPWCLMAKMDEQEIYAPVRERGQALGFLLAMLMVGVTLGLNLLWRQRDITFLRRQVTTEHERFVLAQRLAHLMKHANDIIVITDDQWRILEANDRGLEEYGYTLTELRELSASKLQAATTQADFPGVDERFRRQGHVITQTVHQRKDGSTFPVEASTRKVEIDGVTHHLVIIRDITERKRLESELLEISEREQRRIADDLHDGLGQQLGGISCLTDALSKNLAQKSSEEAAAAAKISRLLTGAVAQTRGLARGLHPVESEANGLMSALDDLASRVSDLFKVSCHFQCPRAVLIKDNATATHLYRIAQEAVTNAIKHGRAQHIEIEISATPDQITLTVSDDGTGFKPDTGRQKGMGLRIMSHRAGMIGGTVSLRPRRGGGTEVVCSVRNDDVAVAQNGNSHDTTAMSEHFRRG